MSYNYNLEDLLLLLHPAAPTKVAAVTVSRRRVEHGLLTVGLKIHCLDEGQQFETLVTGLGGPARILEINRYKNARSSMCLVLPPLGNARSAILLLECIEHSIRSVLFGNPMIQIQVCSPGRLSVRRSAILAIAHYLGSDVLRRYDLSEFETTFATDATHPRGRRLVLYDADGMFDAHFDWWRVKNSSRVVDPVLPLSGRTDLLCGSGSKLEVSNINLLATLLIHLEQDGFWAELGRKFEGEMETLLKRHRLIHLIDAPWVLGEGASSGDDYRFSAALQELTGYAFQESVDVRNPTGRKLAGIIPAFWDRRLIPARSSDALLVETHNLLRKYRIELEQQSHRIQRGGRT